jgi:galactokinase
LKEGNLEALGQLMLETHRSLSTDDEVSCNELDFLVDVVKDLNAVLGARMMGGGFGGCTLNIVKSEEIDNLINMVSAKYLDKFGIRLDAYVVETDSGTSHII